ncbi:MAG: hypothetical protein AAF667_20285 [Pseudomonadota bacterium]
MFKQTLLAFTFAVGASAATADSPVGRWTSLACELRPGDQHLTRDITIDDNGTWSGSFAFFTGPGCEDSFMTFHAAGPWEDLGASDSIGGANSANFTIETAEIETFHESAVGFLSSATCGAKVWSIGARQDVTETGCAPLGMAFPITEHEIVLVREEMLFFGARPNDGSGLSAPEARPTALQVPLVRN